MIMETAEGWQGQGITTNQFSKSLLGCEVHFLILRMRQSFLLWIGTEPSFKTLAVAMKSRLNLVKCALCVLLPDKHAHTQDSQPICTQLLGDTRSMSSSSLSKSLGAYFVLYVLYGCVCVCMCLVRDTSQFLDLSFIALKTGCQCFVSMNIADKSIRLLAEEHLSELCTNHPEMFSF